jgi:mycothiol system anti-sigma-R factor
MDQRDDCRDIVEKLYEFLDGELTEERKSKIRHHLDECSPCLEAFEFETELRAMISAKSQEKCPGELLSKISALLQGEDLPKNGQE